MGVAFNLLLPKGAHFHIGVLLWRQLTPCHVAGESRMSSEKYNGASAESEAYCERFSQNFERKKKKRVLKEI